MNDYIHYQLRKQDGTYIPVLDQGRIVESEYSTHSEPHRPALRATHSII